MSSSYNLTEPKAILAESLSEIVALADIVKQLHAAILEAQNQHQQYLQLVQEDVDQLGRSLNEFAQNITTFRDGIICEVNQAAADAFDEQLKKVETAIADAIAKSNKAVNAKKSWWRR